ncbi:MAG: TlpA family protein disulfide reductase [Flavobacteriaceae bacterium]|jgi:thiol-disulfide isomerase/thioredoxin|nr:TlpA family protein disulfide reductase [Flavobacteriaceae bacterium]
MKKIFLWNIFIVVFFSCSEKSEKKTDFLSSDSLKFDKTQNIQKEKNTPALAPKITVATFDQIQQLYEKQSDTIYITNYWATWCPPCVEEIPEFIMLQSAYQDFKVKFIFVSLDDLDTQKSAVLPFVGKHQMNNVYQFVSPSETTKIEKLVPDWEGSIPLTIIQKGNYSEDFIGGQSADFLIQKIGDYFKK